MALALIIEDHPLFSDALGLTLSGFDGITAVEAVGRLDIALARLARAPMPGIIVLDLHLPDVTGLDGLIRLKAVAGQVPIVVVSSLAEPRVITAVLQAGAAGFVPKHSERAVFRDAFDRIMAGGRYAPEGSGVDPNGPISDSLFAKLALMTPQQARILQLICAGKLNKQIAFDLSITEPTVKAHVTAIMRKLGVQSRTQAVLLARSTDFDALLAQER